jgi:hypothetical protein
MAFVVTAVAAEVVTVASIATAVAELGMTLSVVGAVTGSKDLMKVGGYLGLAGGVTSLAAGAFSAAEGAAAEGLAGEGLGGAGGAMGQAGDYGMQAASQSGMDGVASLAADDTASVLSDVAGSANAPAAFNDTRFDSLGSGPDMPGASAPSSPASPSNASDIGAPSTQTPYSDARNSGAGSGYGNSPGGSTFADIANWYNKQPDAVKAAIIKGGASAVGGLFQGWTEEQKLALERNKFALKQQEATNLSAQPTINFQSRPTGIINAARGA